MARSAGTNGGLHAPADRALLRTGSPAKRRVGIVTPSISIAGLILTPLRQIADERGAVLHMLRADAAEFRGFGECYFSEIRPGVAKAWKRHQRQTQNLA